MQVILKNDYGELIIGCNGKAKLINIDGLSIPQKETQTVSYSGQAGQTTLSVRDMPRAITLTVDFKGRQDDILRLYRMIYNKVDITILSGDVRRKTSGLCVNPSDVENIIYHRMYKAVLQFVCDDPYFHDISETRFDINRRKDMFPNLLENGTYYVSLPAVATVRTNATGITNNGAVKVYPIIEIYNNTADEVSSTTTGLTIQNTTTGAVIEIERDMKPSEQITIDLPHRKIISSIDGNITNYISDNTVLSEFYLEVDNNDINVENKNSLQETVTIVRFNNNYESAVI